MGSTLSFPATIKNTETGGDARFDYAVSEMQGWRITMEDSHAIVLDLDDGTEQKNSFFAVYDGHGGSSVAKFASSNVHKRLLSEECYQKKQYGAALKRAFLGTDEDLLANPAHTRDPSGCTAVAALITNDGKIYVANAGDSRSVLSVKGEGKPLSFDHKPSNDTEKARISAAGGYIDFGRVNGNLALSRALGDFEFKKNYALPAERQVITADPDITVHQITEEDEFLVLACDGIWDCLSSQQAVDFIRFQISEDKSLQEIGEMMCEHLLAPDTSSGGGFGCDNMTVMIIALLGGRTKEEWRSWIKERVKNGYGYATPSELPQIYSPTRMLAFKTKREIYEAREKAREERNASHGGFGSTLSSKFISPFASLTSNSSEPYDSEEGYPSEEEYNRKEEYNRRNNLGPMSFLSSAAHSGFARVLGSTGGISFSPGSGIMSDNGKLMFGGDGSDSDPDSEEDDEGAGSGIGGGVRSFGMGGLGAGAWRKNEESVNGQEMDDMQERLNEFKKQIDEMPDLDGPMPEHDTPPPETPLPSSSSPLVVNGVTKIGPQESEKLATTDDPETTETKTMNSIVLSSREGEGGKVETKEIEV